MENNIWTTGSRSSRRFLGITWWLNSSSFACSLTCPRTVHRRGDSNRHRHVWTWIPYSSLTTGSGLIEDRIVRNWAEIARVLAHVCVEANAKWELLPCVFISLVQCSSWPRLSEFVMLWVDGPRFQRAGEEFHTHHPNHPQLSGQKLCKGWWKTEMSQPQNLGPREWTANRHVVSLIRAQILVLSFISIMLANWHTWSKHSNEARKQSELR